MHRHAQLGGLAAAVACAILSGCGGGGGGGGAPATPATPATPVAPAPSPTTALTLTTDNAEPVATLAFKLLAGPLRIVQVARNVLPGTLGVGAPTVYTYACPSRGAVDVDFTDTDNSRTVTPGDALRLVFRDCDAITPTLTARGELRVAIGATPTGLAADATGYGVTLDAPTGLRLTSPDQPALEYTGSFQATIIEAPGQITWEARAGTSGELVARTIDTSTGKQTTETLVGFSAKRVVDYDQARIASQFAATIRSEALVGQVVVRTPAAISSDLNTYPDAGRIEIDGAGSGRITVASNLELNSESASVSLDANGDGTLELRDRVTAWTKFNDGQLWIEPRYDAGRLNLQTYRVVRAAGYLGSRGTAGEVPVFPVIELQFTRRIASVANLGYVFRQGTVSTATAPDVPAVPDVYGARLLLRPATQLVHGKPYAVIPAGTFVDEGGLTVRPPTLNVQTRNNLVARITSAPRVVVYPGAPFTLDSATSLSTDGAIRAWRWRQLSGTTAVLQDANTSRVSIAPGAPTQPAGERLQFELAVENAAGEVATTTVPVEVATAGSTQTIIGVVRFWPVGAPASTTTAAVSATVDEPFSETATLDNGTGSYTCCHAGVYQRNLDPFRPEIIAMFQFRAQNSLLGLVPGTYAVAGPVDPAYTMYYGTTPGFVVRFPELHAGPCDIVTAPGAFTIHESQQAADGRPTRLAVDFTFRCGPSGDYQATGALRYRSAWPLPAAVLGP